jgi:hypothetical protein
MTEIPSCVLFLSVNSRCEYAKVAFLLFRVPESSDGAQLSVCLRPSESELKCGPVLCVCEQGHNPSKREQSSQIRASPSLHPFITCSWALLLLLRCCCCCTSGRHSTHVWESATQHTHTHTHTHTHLLTNVAGLLQTLPAPAPCPPPRPGLFCRFYPNWNAFGGRRAPSIKVRKWSTVHRRLARAPEQLNSLSG